MGSNNMPSNVMKRLMLDAKTELGEGFIDELTTNNLNKESVGIYGCIRK